MKEAKNEARKFLRNGNPDMKGFETYLNSFLPVGSFCVFDDNGEIIDGESFILDNVFTRELKKYFFRELEKIREDKNARSNKRREYQNALPKNQKEDVFIAYKKKQILKVIDRLTLEEATYLMKSLIHLTMKSKGILVDKNGKPLERKDLMDFWGTKNTRTTQLLKKFKELKIITELPHPKDGRQKIYSVNRKYHSVGQKINEVFAKIYRGKLKELSNNQTIGNALGALYKLIPYFHWQTFYICWNPDDDIRVDKSKMLIENLEFEETIYGVDHMLQKEMAEVVGITPETMNRYIAIYEDLKIMKRDEQGDSVLHMIHPDFVYRQDTYNNDEDYKKFIIYQWKQHQRIRSNKGRKNTTN